MMLRFILVVAVLTVGSEAAAQGKLPDETVLASGDGFKITAADFRDYIAGFEPLAQHRYLGEDTVRAILADMIDTAVFSAHAEEEKLKGAATVQKQVRELAVRELLVKVKAEQEDQAIGDKEIKKYFDEHPQRFLQGALRRASVLLVKDQEAAAKLQKKAAKLDTKAFAELVRTNSVNQETRMRGGDLGYFNRDGIPLQLLQLYAADPSQAPKGSNIDPVLAKAAFELDTVGLLSPVLKVGENFAFIRLTGKREPKFKTWQDAKEHIRVQLAQERSRSSSDALVDRLRAEQEVKVTPKPLETYVYKEQPRKPHAPPH